MMDHMNQMSDTLNLLPSTADLVAGDTGDHDNGNNQDFNAINTCTYCLKQTTLGRHTPDGLMRCLNCRLSLSKQGVVRSRFRKTASNIIRKHNDGSNMAAIGTTEQSIDYETYEIRPSRSLNVLSWRGSDAFKLVNNSSAGSILGRAKESRKYRSGYDVYMTLSYHPQAAVDDLVEKRNKEELHPRFKWRLYFIEATYIPVIESDVLTNELSALTVIIRKVGKRPYAPPTSTSLSPPISGPLTQTQQTQQTWSNESAISEFDLEAMWGTHLRPREELAQLAVIGAPNNVKPNQNISISHPTLDPPTTPTHLGSGSSSLRRNFRRQVGLLSSVGPHADLIRLVELPATNVDDDEPVMKATAFPGDEWISSWEGDDLPTNHGKKLYSTDSVSEDTTALFPQPKTKPVVSTEVSNMHTAGVDPEFFDHIFNQNIAFSQELGGHADFDRFVTESRPEDIYDMVSVKEEKPAVISSTKAFGTNTIESTDEETEYLSFSFDKASIRGHSWAKNQANKKAAEQAAEQKQASEHRIREVLPQMDVHEGGAGLLSPQMRPASALKDPVLNTTQLLDMRQAPPITTHDNLLPLHKKNFIMPGMVTKTRSPPPGYWYCENLDCGTLNSESLSVIACPVCASFNTNEAKELKSEAQLPAQRLQLLAYGINDIAESRADSCADTIEASVSDPASSLLSDLINTDSKISTMPTSVSQSISYSEEVIYTDNSFMTFRRYKDAVAESEAATFHDDIESVSSVLDDVQSQADSSIAGLVKYRQAAVGYFVQILTADTELFALYQTATQTIQKDRFIRNHRRLLKKLFLDFNLDGRTPSQKLALEFLKSRSRRSHISSEIFHAFVKSSDTIREIKLLVKEDEKNLTMLDRYLEGLDTAARLDPNANAERELENDIISSSDESGDGIQDDDRLSRLVETGDFITSSSHFIIFKYNFRVFLGSEPQNASAGVEGDKTGHEISLDTNLIHELLDTRYIQSSTIGLISILPDMCKWHIEYFAGAKLSWWPLRNPDEPLKEGYIRIYSKQFGRSRFFDDIPATLANSIFSGLEPAGSGWHKYVPQFLRRNIILLHNTTLMRILYLLVLRNNTGQNQIGCDDQTNSDPGTTSSSSSDSSNTPSSSNQTASPPNGSINLSATLTQNSSSAESTDPVVCTSNYAEHPGQANDPVIFLSVNLRANQAIARSVKLGTDDKTTFQALRKEYKRLCTKWLRVKHATGIKFYRFQSFLFKQHQDVHYIDVHNDKERYPQKIDPEYTEYSYKPQPWPKDWPYPSNEVWHYFNHPEDCGTSAVSKNMLPVRVCGPITSRHRAFGMHLEERYSTLAILLPSFILLLLTLIPCSWFFSIWLASHPDDLQNAAVPVNLALSILALVLNFPISLLIFRWTAT